MTDREQTLMARQVAIVAYACLLRLDDVKSLFVVFLQEVGLHTLPYDFVVGFRHDTVDDETDALAAGANKR